LLLCVVASQSSGRRRQVLEKIRAKRETMIKTEDSDELSEHIEDNRSVTDSIGSQTNLFNAISSADVKSLLAEYVGRTAVSSSSVFY